MARGNVRIYQVWEGMSINYTLTHGEKMPIKF